MIPSYPVALQRLVDAIDGWEVEPAPGDPLAVALADAREKLNLTTWHTIPPAGIERIAARLDELADVVTQGREAVEREFTMRIPAEPYRDADLVLSTAARLLRENMASTEQQQAEDLSAEVSTLVPWLLEAAIEAAHRDWPTAAGKLTQAATLLSLAAVASPPVPLSRWPIAWGNFRDDGTCVGLSQHRDDIDRWQSPRPLYLADPQTAELKDALTERVAQAVYESMRFSCTNVSPAWVKGGNSIMQGEARRTARAILALP